jgi:hypothetical protein
MHPINGNPLQIAVESDEQITIHVEATNTAFLVNGVFDGSTFDITENPDATFDVSKTKHRLTMLFTFANADGDNGRYDVRITGDAPGSIPSQFRVHQQFGIPATSVIILFRVAA